MLVCPSVILVVCALYLFEQAHSISWPFTNNESHDDTWKGKWFPAKPGEFDSNPTQDLESLKDPKHGIKMGVKHSGCDDANNNLVVDWDNSPTNYTCYDDKKRYLPNSHARPIYSCEHIPTGYHALHACMRDKLTPNAIIPVFGTHRPLWARYGEYRFLPWQRWLHNLEHGGIAMLYHPCANPTEIQLLRKLLISCLFKHVITPYTQLTAERPLALVAWGCRLEISKVDPEIALTFIRKHGNKGPEKTPVDGQYDLELLQPADIVSTANDDKICPNSELTPM